MVYFTLSQEVEEGLSASEILQLMKDAATRWGKCINKTPKTRKQIKNNRNNYYMEVGYES
tara:strand:- start:1917 stop:2096 length:180 start_codon:yes stop_codon:yes gene_type:complete